MHKPLPQWLIKDRIIILSTTNCQLNTPKKKKKKKKILKKKKNLKKKFNMT
jgi:hypothetical protein